MQNKKILSLFIIVAMLFSFSMTAISAEMILNGGFENLAAGTAISAGTTLNDVFSTGNGSGVISDTYSKTGGKSAKITQNGSLTLDSALNYMIALETGKTYEISAWVRFDPSYMGSSEIYIRIAGFDNAFFNDRGRAQGLTGSSDFVKITTIVTLPAGNDYSKSRINISSAAHAGEIMYVDDISCDIHVPVGPPDPPDPPTPPAEGSNLIANSSFEEPDMPSNLTIASGDGTIMQEYAHTGSSSLKIVQTANYGAANYSVSVAAGKTYYYAAWVRFSEALLAGSSVYIRLFPPNASTAQLIQTPAFSGTAGWVKLEGVITIPADAPSTPGRLNIAANPISGAPITFYIDDVELIELSSDLTVSSIETNKVGDLSGKPICPTLTEITLTFNSKMAEASLTPASLKLNGQDIASGKIILEPDTTDLEKVKIKLLDLSYAKNYTLTLNDNTWKDIYGRFAVITPISFKVTPKLFVGAKKLYLNNTLITDGKLKVGKIKGEISGIQNMSGASGNASVILALYENNEIIDIKNATAQILTTENGSSTIFAEMDITSVTDRVLKMYIWDDLKSGLTLSEALVLN